MIERDVREQFTLLESTIGSSIRIDGKISESSLNGWLERIFELIDKKEYEMAFCLAAALDGNVGVATRFVINRVLDEFITEADIKFCLYGIPIEKNLTQLDKQTKILMNRVQKSLKNVQNCTQPIGT